MVDFVRLFFYLQTVRLVSKDGTERYEMQPNETVQDLKKKVQARIITFIKTLTFHSFFSPFYAFASPNAPSLVSCACLVSLT